MEKSEITLSFDSERMRAMTIYLKMENTTVQEKMDEAMQQLYESTVPEPVREYLDAVSTPPVRPKRPPRPSRSKGQGEPVKTPPPSTDDKAGGG